MAEWPELGAELARKSLDHFLDQARKNAEGILSDVALYLVADTIITITQGLMPAEDWQVIYAAREDLKLKLRIK